MDTETNLTNSQANRYLLGIAISTDTDDFYIPVNHQGTLFTDNFKGHLPEDVLLYDKPLIMHNAKFDLAVLKKAGFKLDTNQLFDTMLMHHYIDEYPPHGLKELAEARLGFKESKEQKNLITRLSNINGGYEAVPMIAMAQYAMQDTRMTYNLYHNLLPDWLPEHRTLWETTDRPFLFLLQEMEEKGLRIDRQLAAQLSSEADKRSLEIMQELGFDPAKPYALASKLYDLPPSGLGLKPLAFGSSGRPVMDEAVLTKHAHPVCATVLEFRALGKANSAYYTAYLGLSAHDGRLHPSFLQHGTVTGRLSCAEPNLQQIPREDKNNKIKKLFLPEEGCELWEFDYSSFEARLIAVYAREPKMLEIFHEDKSIHEITAKRIGTDKYTAKTTLFASLYGAGASKIASVTGKRRWEAEKIINDLKQEYPLAYQASDYATEVANYQHWVRLWTGRRRHFRWPSDEHKAFNSIIQGGCFEIVKQGMLNVANAGYDVRSNVHDSAWVNIPKADVPSALQEIPKLMSDWTEEAFGLKFTVEWKKLN